MSTNRCIGKKHYNLSHTTKWYGLANKPITDDTRCEYCYQQMKLINPSVANTMYPIQHTNNRIDCDSISDPSLSKITVGGMLVGILDPTETIPFLVNPKAASQREHGVLVVNMPPVQDYVIEIKQTDYMPSDVYYTISATVGNKRVVINDGKLIYYSGRAVVRGFETGGSDSFKFIAAGNITDRTLAKEFADAGADSNIIQIVIDKYRRIPKRSYWGSMRGYNYDTIGTFGMTITKNGSARPVPVASAPPSVLGASAACSSTYDSSRETACVANIGQASTSLLGGRTGSGGMYVEPVKTTSTADTFDKIGTHAITIQLVHETTSPTGVINPVVPTPLTTDSLTLRHLEEQKKRLADVMDLTGQKHKGVSIKSYDELVVGPHDASIKINIPNESQLRTSTVPVVSSNVPTMFVPPKVSPMTENEIRIPDNSLNATIEGVEPKRVTYITDDEVRLYCMFARSKRFEEFKNFVFEEEKQRIALAKHMVEEAQRNIFDKHCKPNIKWQTEDVPPVPPPTTLTSEKKIVDQQPAKQQITIDIPSESPTGVITTPMSIRPDNIECVKPESPATASPTILDHEEPKHEDPKPMDTTDETGWDIVPNA